MGERGGKVEWSGGEDGEVCKEVRESEGKRNEDCIYTFTRVKFYKKLNKRDDTRTNKEEKKRRNAKVAAANVTICYC